MLLPESNSELFRRTLKIFLLALCAVLVVLSSALGDPLKIPHLTRIRDGRVEVSGDGAPEELLEGNRIGNWTFMGLATNANKPKAVFEDFSTMQGNLLILDLQGHHQIFGKSLEPTFVAQNTLYRGHTLKEVLNSDHDLLGAEILAQPNDPSFQDVVSCFVPITKMETYTFVGTHDCPDKIGVAYGGRTGNFDPAVYVPAIDRIRNEGRVLDGLIGGWQPVLRFVYPERPGDWSELVMFAPVRTNNANSRIQPVWYRVSRIESNQLKWAKYFDSYHPFPPRREGSAFAFYEDFQTMCDHWEHILLPGMKLDLPDARLAHQARHSLVRSMMTRVGAFPKYGVMDRNYGGAEHDGFQDTFNVDATAMIEWGLFDLARDYIDNYFTFFVHDDGSILYRGPETGQYGRMLTVLAEYAAYAGDEGLLLKHRKRIDAVTRLLLTLRKQAQTLPSENPAYGIIAGWCEADACLDPEPARYLQPYFSNSSEAARGFADLGAAWERLGRSEHQPELAAWGAELRRASVELNADLQIAIGRSVLTNTAPACLPTIAGAKEPFDVVVPRDVNDPQFRAYRANMEMLFSGNLTRSQVEMIVRYREAHRDILLGVPAAYGYNSGEMGGFLSYGHAFGLLQHDLVREFLLELYSLSAHQYTRGTWTAPETRRIDPSKSSAPYCVPAQLAIPLMLRWMLAFEDPSSNILWLCKAIPRDWLKAGCTIGASGIPTRSGRVGFQIQSHIHQGRVEVVLELPNQRRQGDIQLRLRVPEQKRMKYVIWDEKQWLQFDPLTETITLPASASGKTKLGVDFQ